MPEIRVRFAPSPTGHLHIGSARTALFNWLFARSQNGRFILRVEDTDRERSTEQFERSILEDLAWLGLNWDEGPDIGGGFGPYRQTERAAVGLYSELAGRLRGADLAYECFCTPAELQAERQAALAAGRMPMYSGRCRGLSAEQRQAFVNEGRRRPAVRFAVPAGRLIRFNDLIRGPLEISTEVLGDFIILRENGAPTYNFAVVADDAGMKITHVLRGEDHITNTARQLLLFEALGFAPPAFGHFSMILGPDKAKLSKRHGAAAVGDYRREGYLAPAIVNYLALLSWSSATGAEIFDVAELTKEFSLDRVSKSPAVFDADKLKWLNGQHIRRLNPADLTNLLLPYLVEDGFIEPVEISAQFSRLERIAEAIQSNLEVLADAPRYAKIFKSVALKAEAEELLAKENAKKIRAAFAAALSGRQSLSKDEAKELIARASEGLKAEGVKGKEIFQTLRAALTGELSGPELFYLIYALGPEEAAARIKE